MALQGYIKVNGKKYGLVEAEYSFSQDTDSDGKPKADVKGGQIKIVMPTTSDDDQFFYRWMFHESQVYSGYLKFTIYSHDNRKVHKTVGFVNAYCTSLRDYFSNNDSKLMYTTVTLHAEHIIVGYGGSDPSSYSHLWDDLEEAVGAKLDQIGGEGTAKKFGIGD